ncbi:hypothetical protein HDU79_006919 [Rhizoclosmatium sp. JEL0117]|nr:hypothetical protein HDU79_006919 [Rhizoclosmatium sp. JEL0117]
MPSVESKPHVLLLGAGGVGKAVLATLHQMFPAIGYATLTIIDKVDYADHPVVARAVENGAVFKHVEVTRKNFESIFTEAFGTKDDSSVEESSVKLFIDLSVGVGYLDVIGWCAKNGVCYVSTAQEPWDDDIFGNATSVTDEAAGEDYSAVLDNTVYAHQQKLKKALGNLVDPQFTAIVDHGMNPGLVSHFCKLGLVKVAEKTLAKVPEHQELANALATKNLAVIGQLLGLRTVHVSEIDTQVPIEPKKDGEFLCTWSPLGFYEEGLCPAQVSWGTHEKELPQNGVPLGPQQIIMKKHSVKTDIKSYVASHGEIKGLLIPHSECATLAEYLTIKGQDGELVYRPTINYVYAPPQCGMDSWTEVFATSGLQMQDSSRVLEGKEIASGEDAVGILLIFERDPVEYLTGNVEAEAKPWCFWSGSILDIDECRKNHGSETVPAPTTMQVVAGVFGALNWMLAAPENRKRGVVWPEALPSDEIEAFAAPWLGRMVFEHFEWDNAPKGCQFKDFLL